MTPISVPRSQVRDLLDQVIHNRLSLFVIQLCQWPLMETVLGIPPRPSFFGVDVLARQILRLERKHTWRSYLKALGA